MACTSYKLKFTLNDECIPYAKEIMNKLEELGLRVHTPSLRYHDLPYEEVEKKVADVSLDEFTDDIVDLIEMLDEVPIVLGAFSRWASCAESCYEDKD